jgi:hypothetical protein
MFSRSLHGCIHGGPGKRIWTQAKQRNERSSHTIHSQIACHHGRDKVYCNCLIQYLPHAKSHLILYMLLQQLRQTHWLRTTLSAVLLCFALSTLANAGHLHPLSKASETHFHCDYCTSFAGVIDAPATTAAVSNPAYADLVVAAPASRMIATRPVSVAQARAPPSC